MHVLIVESNASLGLIWARHLERRGCDVVLSCGQRVAIETLQDDGITIDIIILDLILQDGSAFAVADFASYRQPNAKIIFVTDTSFFSDGSIFQHIPNACVMMPSEVTPDDLTALVEHYGNH